MVTISDFRKQSAQDYGEDTQDGINSEDSVYLVPEQPVEDLPGLRIRIWPCSSTGRDHLIMWTWNWRFTTPGPSVVEMIPSENLPDFQVVFVGGRDEHDTSYGSIAEAAEAAIFSINDYLENELPTERRLEEQQALAEQERKDKIQDQVNDFLNK